jgi:hypothetical protein
VDSRFIGPSQAIASPRLNLQSIPRAHASPGESRLGYVSAAGNFPAWIVAQNYPRMKNSCPVLLALLVALLGTPGRLSAQLANWTNQSPAGVPSMLWSAAYGAGTYVAVGHDGAIVTSADAMVWTRRNSGTTDWIVAVTYANGMFVAVGDNGRILTSRDGVAWTQLTPVTTSRLNGIVHANNLFVVVGENGAIVTSADGVRWTARDSGGITDWLHGIVYSGGAYVAVGQNARLARSPDGITWSVFRLQGLSFNFENIVVAQGLIVAVTSGGPSGNGEIWTASDFFGSWLRRRVNQAGFLEGIAYGPAGFVATGQAGSILTSTDGINWTDQTSGTSRSFTGAFYAGNRYLALGEQGAIFLATLPPSNFANISTRGMVGAGANALIAGTYINGVVPKRVLVRAVGPTLASFGVPGTLARPVLTILNSSGAQLLRNSGWTTSTNPSPAEIAAASQSAGAFALLSNSADSALIASLAPGAYTFQVSSADDSTGVALVEAYELP